MKGFLLRSKLGRWFFFWFVIFLFVFTSFPAAALGKREEGVLLGVGGMLLLNEIDRNRTGVYRGERHPHNEFPRFRCYGDAITCSFEKGVYDRELNDYYQRQYRAYRCGRYGECEPHE